MNIQIKKIGIVGDGGWGTTLAIHLAKKKYPVMLWGPFQQYLRHVQKTRINSKFLPGIPIPRTVKFTHNLQDMVSYADLIVLATPSEYLPQTLKKLKKLDVSQKIILSVTKGIDTKTLLRMSQVIHQELGKVHLAVLSGPTIASEVAKGIPSTAVIASHNPKICKILQKIFNSPNFRIYTNSDVIGVELGGSLKNIIAIASGVCDGLGYGTNTKAAILSRGLAEMARLGKAMGAQMETFYGLTGLGDLVTTCMSPSSRNRCVGEQLGRGRSIKKITSTMAMVAEGVPTVKAAYRLSRRYKVNMPITHEVYNIIYKNKNSLQAVRDLMTRQIRAE